VSYLSEAAAQARRRYCYGAGTRWLSGTTYLRLRAVPTCTLTGSYPGEPGRSLSATFDPFCRLQLGSKPSHKLFGRIRRHTL